MTVHLEGRLDRHTVPAIRRELLSSMRGRKLKKYEIDLSQVSSLDTAGIALMVELLRILLSGKREFQLTGLSESAVKMIRLSRLEALFGLDDDSAGGS